MGFSQTSLTSAIYEMALGRSSWDNILDILSASFAGCVVIVSGDDLAQHTNLVFAQRGLPAAAISGAKAGYAATDPWLLASGRSAPYQVYHEETEGAAEGEPAWMRTYPSGTGVVVLRLGARQLRVEIRYRDGQDALKERAATVLGEAAQHFGRAFEILSRSRFSAGRGYLENVVEDLPFTLFFVSEDMHIHYSNYHAEGMRRQNSGPFSISDGVLRAADPHSDQLLRELVRKTITSKRTPTSVVQIAGADTMERHFAIARMASRHNHHYQLHDAILDPGPLAMLVVHGNLEVSSLPMDLLWRAFGLTDSEARLAEALLAGATLADFAKEREVSKQTLRNQLVGVMRKTGTRRQSELVSLLTRLALTCL